MTGSVFDYSVAAVERAAMDQKMLVLSLESDFIHLRGTGGLWNRGYHLELRRSPSGFWVAAWIQQCGEVFLAFTRTMENPYAIHNCYAYSSDLDELIGKDVRAYSTPAVAIRSTVKRDWYRRRVLPPTVTFYDRAGEARRAKIAA